MPISACCNRFSSSMVCKPTIIQNEAGRPGEQSASVARLEAISHPRLGQDVLRRTGIGLQLLAQLANEDPQIFVLLSAVAAPYGIQDCAMGQDLAWMLRHVQQHIDRKSTRLNSSHLG